MSISRASNSFPTWRGGARGLDGRGQQGEGPGVGGEGPARGGARGVGGEGPGLVSGIWRKEIA